MKYIYLAFALLLHNSFANDFFLGEKGAKLKASLPPAEEIKGVKIQSIKQDDLRIVRAYQELEFNAPMERVAKAFYDFSGRCNQEFSEKRKWLSSKEKCYYPNDNIIEEVVEAESNLQKPLENNSQIKNFITRRRIEKRGNYQCHQKVTIEFSPKKIKVIHRTLDDDESHQFLKEIIEKDLTFNVMTGIYEIESQGPQKSLVKYDYLVSTNHWFLNKDIIEAKLKESIAEGTKKTLLTTKDVLEKELVNVSRN